MKKNLIFCFDGSCHDSSDANKYSMSKGVSNIQKLHIVCGGDFKDNNGMITAEPGTGSAVFQKSFYYSGVGTYGNFFRRILNSIFAPEHIFSDVKKILDNAVRDLKENYSDNCSVTVFGFSRGAAIARRFAAVAKERSGIPNLSIDFMGVFETVACIQGTDLSVKTKPASDVVFENNLMSEDVKKAAHILALDEDRVAFQPTLFNHDPDRVFEFWMPGNHVDIGGGSWNSGVSNWSLSCMISCASKHVNIKFLDDDSVNYSKLNHVDVNGNYVEIGRDDLDTQVNLKDRLHYTHRNLTKKLTQHPREVRISGDNPNGDLPFVESFAMLRCKSFLGYKPRSLRGVKFRIVYADFGDDLNHGYTLNGTYDFFRDCG